MTQLITTRPDGYAQAQVGRKSAPHLFLRFRNNSTLIAQVLDRNEVLRAEVPICVENGEYQVGAVTLYSLEPSRTPHDAYWAKDVIYSNLSDERAVKVLSQLTALN